MAGDLVGKVIIVAGGKDGVGREYALAYAHTKAAASLFCITSWMRHSVPLPIWVLPTLVGRVRAGDVIANAAELLHSSNARFVRGCILPGSPRS
jgi:hypothetical protein